MLVFGFILAAIGGYLLGSVPFGLVLTRAAGLGDIRQIGSGNIGATNVLRTGRKDLALATLLLDALKAGIALVLARWIAGAAGVPENTAYQIGLVAGAAAFIGHCYPVWLGFKGGKGIATFFGVLFAGPWPLGVIAGVTWLAVATIFALLLARLAVRGACGADRRGGCGLWLGGSRLHGRARRADLLAPPLQHHAPARRHRAADRRQERRSAGSRCASTGRPNPLRNHDAHALAPRAHRLGAAGAHAAGRPAHLSPPHRQASARACAALEALPRFSNLTPPPADRIEAEIDALEAMNARLHRFKRTRLSAAARTTRRAAANHRRPRRRQVAETTGDRDCRFARSVRAPR